MLFRSLYVYADNGEVKFYGAVGSFRELNSLYVEAGDRIVLYDNVTTNYDQEYNGNVQIGAWRGSEVDLTSYNGSIYFDQQVDSHGPNGYWNGQASDLYVYADNGEVKFYGAVGSFRELNSLYVEAGDRIVLYDNVTTNYDQEYKDRKSTRLNSSHIPLSRMPSSA